MWIRNVRAIAIFNCCYPDTQNIVMPKPAERRVFITQEFSSIPKKTLIKWAKDVVIKKVKETGRESCGVHNLDICKKINIIDLNYWEEKPEEIFVTGVVFRIIRMRSRGKYHIYGLDDKEYYKRMTEKGFTNKQSDELLKLFKEGLVKTKAKV